MQVEEELNRVNPLHRGFTTVEGTGAVNNRNNTGGVLIIETGSQMVNPNAWGGQRQAGHLDGVRNFPTANSRSINDDESNLGKNARGQTTGEVGGTLYMDEHVPESSQMDIIRLQQSPPPIRR